MSNSYDCHGHYHLSRSFIHILVAETSSGYSDINPSCNFGKPPVRYLPHRPPRPLSACCFSFYDCHLATVTKWAVSEQVGADDQLPLSRALIY